MTEPRAQFCTWWGPEDAIYSQKYDFQLTPRDPGFKRVVIVVCLPCISEIASSFLEFLYFPSILSLGN